MPEFDGIRISRAEELARYAYGRTLAKAVRTAAKGSGWRAAQGTLFRDLSGWFIAAMPSIHIFERRTTLQIYWKPMAIDPIFWRIVDTPENQSTPLSFRLFGVWTCRAPILAELPVDEEGGVETVACRLVASADQQLEAIAACCNFETFLDHLRTAPDDFLPAHVASLIAMHRRQEAIDVCEDAQRRFIGGGFHATPGGSFTTMALAWLSAGNDSRAMPALR